MLIFLSVIVFMMEKMVVFVLIVRVSDSMIMVENLGWCKKKCRVKWRFL